MTTISVFVNILLFSKGVVECRLTQEISASSNDKLSQHRGVVSSRNAVIESNCNVRFMQYIPKYELNHHKTTTIHTDEEVSLKQSDVFLEPHKINDKLYEKKNISYMKPGSLEDSEKSGLPDVEKGKTFKAHKTKLSKRDGDIESRLQARDDRRSNDLVAQALQRKFKTVKYESNKMPESFDPYYVPESVPKPKLASNSLIKEIESYVKYAGASYCTIQPGRNNKCNYCKEFGYGIVTIPLMDTLEFNGNNIKLQAIIVIDSMKEEIILAYRGSDNISKLFGSISDHTVNYPGIPEAKVHTFFYEGVRYIHEVVANKLAEEINNHPDLRLVITGHSLGGALATLAAPLINRDVGVPYSKMRIITYGQLRVGNLAFAFWYNSLKLNFTRVVNENDGATSMPKFSRDWVHVQTEVHIDNGHYYDCKTRKIEHPHCSLDKTSLYGIYTSHEKVHNIDLSPDYCTGTSKFLNSEFYSR